ncbi:hypothetical protein ABID95_007565 [Streptomyces atratus]
MSDATGFEDISPTTLADVLGREQVGQGLVVACA